MYYWDKEPNYTLIECNKCGKILKFDDKYFTHSENHCESNTLLQCSCGNTANGIIKKKKENEKSEYDKSKSSTLHCPHCGNTNIQLVPRKWSLLTGFLTNKVDRVCMKCKKRF